MSNKEGIIPVQQVLDDMYSDGYIASSARAYYYENYATDAERKEMDWEDKIQTIFAFLFLAQIPILLIIAILKGLNVI